MTDLVTRLRLWDKEDGFEGGVLTEAADEIVRLRLEVDESTEGMMTSRELRKQAEAERDALRALLDMVRREQCQCRTCRDIRAALRERS